MTPIVENPFRPTRWEHHSDGLPLIWFTPTAEQLAGDKSAYVHGSRGSGKTSLLKSICWEDLLNNPSLKLQRSLTDSRHIGVYIRLPDHVSGSLGFLNWQELFPNAPQPDWEFFRFFSLAIELICVDKALIACHALRVSGHLNLEASQESRLVKEIFEEYRALENFGDQEQPKSFLSLARVCRKATRRINEASGRGTVQQIVDLLPAREPNDLLSFVIDRLSGVTALQGPLEAKSPGFKFCLDDCEVLNQLQRKSLNTLVRKSRFPISWVLCSVGDSVHVGETFLHQQPLTDADRRVISLDERERNSFFDICQAVASLRSYFSLPEEKRPIVDRDKIAEFFPLRGRLGTQDVNDIFSAIISRSTSPLGHLVQKSARALRDALYAIDERYRERFSRANQKLPYYEAYLLMHWLGNEDAFKTTITDQDIPRMLAFVDKLRAPSFQAWMRRKMVASMLHFAARLGFKRLPLGGASIIISLADGSIRDFLEIMADIYDNYAATREVVNDSPVHERFALSRTKIASRFQAAGIYSASDSFYSGVGAQADADPEALIRLIEALGKYTSLLQSNPDDPSVLGRAERGVFMLDFTRSLASADDSEQLALAGILRRAELAGYLRSTTFRPRPSGSNDPPFTPTQQVVAYRLHRRFAPHFRFSYRGAYEVVRLQLEPLSLICRSANPISADAWLTTVSSHPLSVFEQLSLPWQQEADDE